MINTKEEFNEFEFCDPFDEKYNYWMRVEHLGRYLFAKDIINKNSKVLDIACCDGYGTKILSKYCKKIIGLDRNKEYIEIAIQKYNDNNIKYIINDIDKNNFNEVFDCIVCFETLEHVKYPELLLKKLYNSLNNNGNLLISVPNSKYEMLENDKNIYHLHVFEFEELLTMFKQNNFEVVKVLGQSLTNKIVNKKIDNIKTTNIVKDAINLGYPNEIDIDETYSYIFILKKNK